VFPIVGGILLPVLCMNLTLQTRTSNGHHTKQQYCLETKLFNKFTDSFLTTMGLHGVADPSTVGVFRARSVWIIASVCIQWQWVTQWKPLHTDLLTQQFYSGLCLPLTNFFLNYGDWRFPLYQLNENLLRVLYNMTTCKTCTGVRNNTTPVIWNLVCSATYWVVRNWWW
jgi:hypothetical protein